MSDPARLCSSLEEPRPGQECWTALWSEGRSCRTCPATCYRQGWTKRQVDHDNAKLVHLTHAQKET